MVASGGLAEPPSGAQSVNAKGTEERRFVINDAGTATVRGAASSDVSWQFTAIPDKPPTIALAKDPEGQARGALLLSYKVEDDYGVVGAQATFKLQDGKGTNGHPPRALYEAPDFPLVLPQARTKNGVGQTTKDLTEHPWAGVDVTMTLTARDEAGNEGQQRAVRVAAAGAAVHQADGARADRAAARARARRRCPGQRADRARCAHARARALQDGEQRLSRPALDLLAAHARQERRPVARRGRAHVGHGGASRGRQRLRRRAGAARGARKRCARRWSAARPTRRSRSSPTSCAPRSTSSCRRWPSSCARIRSSSPGRSIPMRASCARRICAA